MAHIHTEDRQHDHTISFFIIRTDLGAEPRLVYHVHRKTGKLMMFGGHVELDETPWQAFLHELREETGYSPEQLLLLQPKQRLSFLTGAVVHPQPVVHSTGQYPCEPVHFHTDTMYAFVTAEEPAGAPEEGESLEIELYTLAQLRAIPEERITEMWREVGIYILEHIYGEWEEIPLTAYRSTELLIYKKQSPEQSQEEIEEEERFQRALAMVARVRHRDDILLGHAPAVPFELLSNDEVSHYMALAASMFEWLTVPHRSATVQEG